MPYAVLPASVPFLGLAFRRTSKTFLTVTPPGARWQWDTASLQRVEELRFLGTNHAVVDLARRSLAGAGRQGGEHPGLGFPLGVGWLRTWSLRKPVFALISPGGNLLNRRGAVFESPHRPSSAGGLAGDYLGINLETLRGRLLPDEKNAGHRLWRWDGWWDLATGQRQAQFDSQYSHGVHVAFSPTGRPFATRG